MKKNIIRSIYNTVACVLLTFAMSVNVCVPVNANYDGLLGTWKNSAISASDTETAKKFYKLTCGKTDDAAVGNNGEVTWIQFPEYQRLGLTEDIFVSTYWPRMCQYYYGSNNVSDSADLFHAFRTLCGLEDSVSGLSPIYANKDNTGDTGGGATGNTDHADEEWKEFIEPFEVPDSADANDALSKLLGVLIWICRAFGGCIFLWGCFLLFASFKREDSDSKQRALMPIVVGSILIGFQAILSTLQVIG